MDLAPLIRAIPDYPKPGILFRDITTLLGHRDGFRATIDQLTARYAGERIRKVAGIEARGFILGGALADRLNAGFVPIRKKGKLPHATIGREYDLEYGTDRVEIHVDAVSKGERTLVIDDLIATGGTALAASMLLRECGADIVEAAFVIDLPDLGGRARLTTEGIPSHALVAFPGH
ncbi:MAG: adenine phosphoribosyltransferase [Polyangiaceae bacterium]